MKVVDQGFLPQGRISIKTSDTNALKVTISTFTPNYWHLSHIGLVSSLSASVIICTFEVMFGI